MRAGVSAATALVLIVAACGRPAAESVAGPVIDPGDGGHYVVDLDPARFTATVDNPWFSLPPGASWVYQGTADDAAERTDVVVTGQTRVVSGITATVVHDTVSTAGELIEDTYDWYAQDSDGNVWYLGEDTKEYEGGKVVSTKGSWQAGVDGAKPGVVMWADPQPGKAYRQEFYPGEAEDLAEVIAVDGAASVPAGSWSDALVIREWNPLEPAVVEEKTYVRGVGLVLERVVRGGSGGAELVHRG